MVKKIFRAISLLSSILLSGYITAQEHTMARRESPSKQRTQKRYHDGGAASVPAKPVTDTRAAAFARGQAGAAAYAREQGFTDDPVTAYMRSRPKTDQQEVPVEVTTAVECRAVNDLINHLTVTHVSPDDPLRGTPYYVRSGQACPLPPISINGRPTVTLNLIIQNPQQDLGGQRLDMGYTGLYQLSLNTAGLPKELAILLHNLLTPSVLGQPVSRQITLPQPDGNQVQGHLTKRSLRQIEAAQPVQPRSGANHSGSRRSPAAGAAASPQPSSSEEPSTLAVVLSVSGSFLKDVAVATPGAVAGAASATSRLVSGAWGSVGSWWSNDEGKAKITVVDDDSSANEHASTEQVPTEQVPTEQVRAEQTQYHEEAPSPFAQAIQARQQRIIGTQHASQSSAGSAYSTMHDGFTLPHDTHLVDPVTPQNSHTPAPTPPSGVVPPPPPTPTPKQSQQHESGAGSATARPLSLAEQLAAKQGRLTNVKQDDHAPKKQSTAPTAGGIMGELAQRMAARKGKNPATPKSTASPAGSAQLVSPATRSQESPQFISPKFISPKGHQEKSDTLKAGSEQHNETQLQELPLPPFPSEIPSTDTYNLPFPETLPPPPPLPPGLLVTAQKPAHISQEMPPPPPAQTVMPPTPSAHGASLPPPPPPAVLSVSKQQLNQARPSGGAAGKAQAQPLSLADELAQRQGKLKKVEDHNKKQDGGAAANTPPKGGMLGALAQEMAKRRIAMTQKNPEQSDEEEKSGEESDWSD